MFLDQHLAGVNKIDQDFTSSGVKCTGSAIYTHGLYAQRLYSYSITF